MTRKEKLKKLQSIEGVLIGELVMTYDMGIQFGYMTKDGYGYNFGTIGEWPVINIIDETLPDKWETIISKINEGSLTCKDLKDTVLKEIAYIVARLDKIASEDEDPDEEVSDNSNISNFFTPFKDIPKNKSNVFYIIIDLGQWELEEPEVFTSEDSVKEAFIERYCEDITPWEDLDDKELDDWLEKLDDEDEYDGFIYLTLKR